MRIFEGIWPALVTPLGEDRHVNVPVLRQLVDYLIAKSVDGFFVGGTTGEGIYLGVPDRKRLLETVIDQVAGRLPVIAHVGATASGDAIELVAHARDCGAAAVSSILPPMYTDWRVLRRYFGLLGETAPDLPLFVYLFNPLFDSAAFLHELATIPNFSGGKYTGPNMYEMRRMIDMGAGRWTVWSGMDEQCVYAAMMGATGAIGSTLNFMPGVYRQIRACVQQGDHAAAQALQLRANQVTAVLIAHNFQPALKEVLTMLGLPVGQPTLPHLPLSEGQRASLHRSLAETAFDELVRL